MGILARRGPRTHYWTGANHRAGSLNIRRCAGPGAEPVRARRVPPPRRLDDLLEPERRLPPEHLGGEAVVGPDGTRVAGPAAAVPRRHRAAAHPLGHLDDLAHGGALARPEVYGHRTAAPFEVLER